MSHSVVSGPGPIARRPTPTPATLAEQVLTGRRQAIAQAITVVERGGDRARELLARLYPHTGRAHIVGITGAPGSGKSTLVAALVKSYRAAGLAVGVIAIDPTSPFTGGAILGDRVRMRDLSGDNGVFVRSMATRGSVGGLSRTAGDAVAVLDAAGFPRILVETVGVGQAEIEIAATAHTTVVVEAPGMGDEIQAIKAGILEIADLLVVNKADRPEADRTVQALQMMLDLGKTHAHPVDHNRHHMPQLPEPGGDNATPPAQSSGDSHMQESATHESNLAGWEVQVCKTVAADGTGIDTVQGRLEAHAGWLRESGEWQKREARRAAHWLQVALQAEFRRRLSAGLPAHALEEQIEQLRTRATDPYTAAHALLAALNGTAI